MCARYSNAIILYFSPNGNNSRLHISCYTCPANFSVELVNKHLRTCATAPVMCGGHHKFNYMAAPVVTSSEFPQWLFVGEISRVLPGIFGFPRCTSNGANERIALMNMHWVLCTHYSWMSSFRFLNNLMWVSMLLLCFIESLGPEENRADREVKRV